MAGWSLARHGRTKAADHQLPSRHRAAESLASGERTQLGSPHLSAYSPAVVAEPRCRRDACIPKRRPTLAIPPTLERWSQRSHSVRSWVGSFPGHRRPRHPDPVWPAATGRGEATSHAARRRRAASRGSGRRPAIRKGAAPSGGSCDLAAGRARDIPAGVNYRCCPCGVRSL